MLTLDHPLILPHDRAYRGAQKDEGGGSAIRATKGDGEGVQQPRVLERPIRVLLAEPSPGDRRLIAMELENLACPVELLNAGTGEDVLANLQSGAPFPDLLAIDPILPMTDGWQVIEHIRSNRYPADMAIVLLASAPIDLVTDRARDLGIEAVVEKPLTAETFLRLMRFLGLACDTPLIQSQT